MELYAEAKAYCAEQGETQEAQLEATLNPPILLQATQSWKDDKVTDNLQQGQYGQVHQILQTYKDVLTDIPSKTNLIYHDVNTTTEQPFYKIKNHIEFQRKLRRTSRVRYRLC